MKEKVFPYTCAPAEAHAPFLNADLNLMQIDSQCKQEVSLQQDKRDKMISFYLTMAGLVTAFLFGNETALAVKSLILLALFVIGVMWLTVALRCPIFKEVNQIASRTIARLHTMDRSRIDKALLLHTFYAVMVGEARAIPLDAKGKPRPWTLAWQNRTSAEYLMYMTLALLSGLCGCLSVTLPLTALGWGRFVLAGGLLTTFLLRQTWRYSKTLIDLYAVTRDRLDSSFHRTFAKAWQLHFFS